MSDSLVSKIFLLITFIGLFCLLGAGLNNTIVYAIRAQDPENNNDIASEYFDPYVWSPENRTYTPSDLVYFKGTVRYPGMTSTGKVTYTRTDEVDISVWFCYEALHPSNRFLYFYTKYKAGLWIGYHTRGETVSLDSIIDGCDPYTGNSSVYFDLRHLMRLDVMYDPTLYSSFVSAIDNNTFSMTLITPSNITISDTNPWHLVGRMLNFQLPGTPQVVQYMLAIPFYGMVAAVVLAVISRFIPFVRGV